MRRVLGQEQAPAERISRVISVFREASGLAAALREAKARDLGGLAVFSPVGLPAFEHLLPRRGSPIRFFVLAAGITGCILAFWMCIGSALLYGLIVGGKWPASWLPYCVIGFELTILLGGLATVAAILALGRLSPRSPRESYDPRVQVDKFAIAVCCDTEQLAAVDRLLRDAGAEEVHERTVAADEGSG